MFMSVFVVIGVAAAEVGGLTEIWRIAYDRGRVEFLKCVYRLSTFFISFRVIFLIIFCLRVDLYFFFFIRFVVFWGFSFR